MPENLTFNVLLYGRRFMFQKLNLNGDPKPEHEWPSEDYWKEQYPHLFPDSSSGLGDDQEQVGHRNKVKRRHSFDMSFVFEIHFSSLLVVLINALYKIYLTKVILQLSLIASEGLFFCSLIIGHVNCIQSNRHRRFAHQCRGSSIPMTLPAFFYEIKNPSFGLNFFVVFPFS